MLRGLCSGLALFAISSAALVGCSGGDEEGGVLDADVVQFDGAVGVADAAVRTVDAMPGAADAGAFAITSTAYAGGAVIPTLYTCQGDNISPPLAWENPPAGTQGYAIVFTDISTDFLHSVIYDIPMSASSLPQDVELAYEPSDVPGAKQPDSYLGTRGYAGPCPNTEHTYEFKIHAVNMATLSGVAQQSNRGATRTAIEAASLGFTTIEGSFDPNNP